jgi:hypothetical protein
VSSVDRFRLTCFRPSYSKQCQFDYSTRSSRLIRERPRRCETSSSRENSWQPKSRLDGPWDILAGDRGLVSVHANVYPSSHHKDRPSDLRTENFGVRDSCTGNALARIIHERFCCNCRSAATTGLRPEGSPRGSAIWRRTVMNNAG